MRAGASTRTLRHAQSRDFGAYQRAIDEIEAQYGEAAVISRLLEIRVQKAVPEIGATAVVEVHHREGNFADHIDPAHRRVELDAVEDRELAVDAGDIAQMQVAVTLANEAFLDPAQESTAARDMLALGPRGERIDLRPLARIIEQRPDGAEIVLRPVQDPLGCPEPGAGRGDLDRAVEERNLARQHVDVRGPELAACKEPACQGVLWELAHFHGVFDRGPVTAHDRGIDAAGDRHDFEVERGREAPVEPQFLLAEKPSRRERREIEKSELDRFLDLVRVTPGQQHVRDVRFQPLDPCAAGPEDRRPRQRHEQPRLILPAFDPGSGSLGLHVGGNTCRHASARRL